MGMRAYEAVVFVGPAQSGKTQGLVFGSLMHDIKCSKSDVLIVQTTKQTATDFERADLSWTIRNTPALKESLAPGGRNDNVYVKTMRSGQNIFIAWPTVSNLSGKALKSVKLTDYDRMDAIPGEGSVFELARKRTTTFLSQGMTLAESSPSGEVTDPQWRPDPNSPHEAPPSQSQILALFNDGDKRRWYVQCPECGEYFLPHYDQNGLAFNINEDLLGATQTILTSPAKYICTVNGCLIDTSHKRKMNASGKWLKEGQTIKDGQVIGEGRKSKIASFWFPGIFAAYVDPQRLAERFLSGLRKFDIEGDEENLRAIVNIDFGAPYLSRRRVAEYNSADYQKRAEAVPEKQVPQGVRFLIAAVDVQGWGFSVAIIGYGLYSERWIIDRYEIRVSNRYDGGQQLTLKPAVHQEDWLKIETDVMEKTYALADGSGRSMKILMTGSDSGGEPGVTTRAYQFWRDMRKKRLNKNFVLLKGENPKPNANRPKVRKSYLEQTDGKRRQANAKGEVPIWIVNTTILKDSLSADLKKDQHAPRYIHFPAWFPETMYAELTAEYRDDEHGWIKQKGKKNELWDQLYYGEAILEAKLQESRLKELNWESPPDWARDWSNNPNVVGTIPKPKPEPAPTKTATTHTQSQIDWIPKQQDWLQ